MADGTLVYIEDKTDGLLGRNIVWHDSENRNHPARTLFSSDILKSKAWGRRTKAFNQQQESSCTFQAAAGTLFTEPFRTFILSPARRAYNTPVERYKGYLKAQTMDPWPGGEPDYLGSSTDAPFKVLRSEGYISAWKWNFGYSDTLSCLSNWGPCAIGINWKEDMMQTDSLGFIRYTGDILGGHAVELYKINVEEEYVVGFNSWGTSWGWKGGRFRMSFTDLRNALEDNGESVTIVL